MQEDKHNLSPAALPQKANYQQTVAYLFSRLPMFSRIGAAAYKADLTNTITLCAALDNPQHTFKSIHIAGTNGKGSTSHMLAATMQTAGYKTGLYTSPHLKDFRERIKVNGQMVTEEFVVDFTQRIRPLIEELEPSFFEITVAMAFEYFSQQQVDVAIVEVGLGGRLDSTNIITPELCIITNIGWDHMNMLGNTLAQIATEKAGIIKPGVPVVIGEHLPETKPVFEQVAAAAQAPIIFASDTYWVANWQMHPHHLEVTVATSELDNNHQHYKLDLQGLYQYKNLLPVIEAVRVLQAKGWRVNSEVLQQALSQVKKMTGLYGRWQIVQHQPTIVLDVAHNREGVAQVVQQLELADYNHLHIVMGFVKDKDVAAVLSQLPGHAAYYFTKAQIPRAMPEEELAALAAKAGLHGTTYPNVNVACKAAMARAAANDFVLVCGSVFVVGECNLF